jgi:hypothetical protein
MTFYLPAELQARMLLVEPLKALWRLAFDLLKFVAS